MKVEQYKRYSSFSMSCGVTPYQCMNCWDNHEAVKRFHVALAEIGIDYQKLREQMISQTYEVHGKEKGYSLEQWSQDFDPKYRRLPVRGSHIDPCSVIGSGADMYWALMQLLLNEENGGQ